MTTATTAFPRGVHLMPCEDDRQFYHLIKETYSEGGGATYCGRWADNGGRWCWCGVGDWSGTLCQICALAHWVSQGRPE